MRPVLVITFLLVLSSTAALAANPVVEEARNTFEPIPFGMPELPNNPATTDKIDLGKALFFDPRLSRSGLISCNTCHNVGMGGDDFQETSTGHGWQRGPRNSPTVLNAVFNIAQFWDGRAEDLKEQAKGPVQASVEMNNTPEGVLRTLNSMPHYQEMFALAFPGQEAPVTFDNMAAAIEVFEATLITPDSRFDRLLRGEEKALSEFELKGLEVFMEKGCAECHNGINMGGHDYYAFGVMETPASDIISDDKGRFVVTNLQEDEYVFKSPTLRNIALTPPYFHSGKVWPLPEAVRIMSSAQLGIQLDEQEVASITAFLQTTTGIQPYIVYPILPASTDATPRPVLE
ncbi:MAG: cytochrome-c peroxidase [Desulforhopalus sp.]